MIKICIEFNQIKPLARWHNDVFTDNLFGDAPFEIVRWDNFKLGENNFLFLYCVPEETMQFLESMPSDFYDTIKNKKIKILFQNEQFNLFMFNGNIFEYAPHVKYNCYDINAILYWQITNMFKKYNIHEEDLFFVHSAKGFLEEIEQMQQRKILWINSTLKLQSKHIQLNTNLLHFKKIQITSDISTNKYLRHHFACLFAGRPAVHRHYLIKNLHLKKLLQYGKCTLQPCPREGDTYQLPIHDLLPIGQVSSHLKGQTSEIEIFQDIFLWVAAETYCPNGYPYFTEKTVKAIVYERPFITYGNPGTLAYLKDYGFKSFGNFWDESYDNEKDDNKKIEMIADIIENICQKNLEEINQMYNKMKPIIQFNKDLLFSTNWRQDLIKFLL